jgi:probable blue pigment (indigoidine) exporter
VSDEEGRTVPQNGPQEQSHWYDAVTAAVAPLVWGSTYLVTTQFLPPHAPLLAATVRALPAGVVLVLIGRTLPAGVWWLRSAVLGALNIGVFFFLLFVAAYRLPGGVAALIGSVQPLVVSGLMVVVLRQRPRAVDVAAALLGVVGVGLLVLRADAALDPIGVLAALGAAASMGTGIVLTQRWRRPVGLLAFTGWQLLAGGLLLLPVALAVEGLPGHLTIRNVGGYVYLSVIGSMVAYALWFRGLGRISAVAASVLGFLSPLVATALGFLVLGQGFTPLQGVGVMVIFVALALTQLRPRRASAPVPPKSTVDVTS